MAFLMQTATLPAQNASFQNAGDLRDSHEISSLITQCTAAFEVIPDSLSSYPYYYHFKDKSGGSINNWLWDFGDGTTSSAQNPTHQYENPGDYTVCLTVSDINDPLNCSDHLCIDIKTLTYFSLGGLVYAGEYPLNNPVNTGDTGIASLYRIVNDQIIFAENNLFQDYGYYWFGYLLPGEYLVKVGLTVGSPNYGKYFPTYWGNQILWTKSGLLDLDESQYEDEIYLQPVEVMQNGAGNIQGYVNFEQGNSYSMPPINQTTVILMDIDQKPLRFTKPNDAGYFDFTGLPFDTYKITADATGKPSTTQTVTLNENSPSVAGLNLTVFGSNANFIPDGPEIQTAMVRIFPNPVSQEITAGIFSAVSAQTSIKILDISGREYFNALKQLEKGYQQFSIPASALPPGMFILLVQPEGNYMPVSAKFVK